MFSNSRCVHEAITIGNYSIFATFVRSLALLLSIVQLTRMHKCKPSAASMLSFSFAMSPQAQFLPCCSGSQRWSCCSLLASSCAALAAQERSVCQKRATYALKIPIDATNIKNNFKSQREIIRKCVPPMMGVLRWRYVQLRRPCDSQLPRVPGWIL